MYTPLIVPPVHLKEFSKPIFTALWRETVSVLSTAKKVVFLGYSMPENDLHVQFIMRCGFHNQSEGIPTTGRKRTAGTGGADVRDRKARPIGGSAHRRCRWRHAAVQVEILTG